MPKTKLGRDPAEHRRQELARTTEKIIRHAMAERDIKYFQDVANMIGVSKGTFTKKIKSGYWTQMDLLLIVSVLKIPAREAIKLLGVKE